MGIKWIPALLALLGLLAAPPRPAAQAGTAVCRCLAVGIDDFVTEEDTGPCSANNAEIMAALFAECLPSGTRITRRVNGPGTGAGMESLIREAFAGAAEGDTSFLYLSTHGVAWEEDGKTRTALMLSDGEREEALDPRQLRAWMDGVPGKKVLILDCCHAGAAAEAFTGSGWRVLASCGPEEDSYFWAAGEETGMGYFTSALENALRASPREAADPDGDGQVSLRELYARIREIYGVSGAVFLPEDDGEPLFRLPADRMAGERIQDLTFGELTEDDGQLTLTFRFRTETAVKMEYRLVPGNGDGWDFSQAVRLSDRERTGLVRGMLSPGEKDRSIRVSRERLGTDGRALLQVVSFRGLYGQVPVPECTRVIMNPGKEEE